MRLEKKQKWVGQPAKKPHIKKNIKGEQAISRIIPTIVKNVFKNLSTFMPKIFMKT